MNKAKFLKGFKIFLFFLGCSPFVLILFIIGVFVRLEWELEQEKAHFKDIVYRTYEDSGFQGQVLNFDVLHSLHSTHVTYQYLEEEGDVELNYDFDFQATSFLDKTKYSTDEIVDLYITDMVDYSFDENERIFRQFFDEALLTSQSIEDYRIAVEKNLKEVGFQEVKAIIDYSREHRPPAAINTKKIKQMLQDDLHRLNAKGYVPIWGINKLDSLKYFQVGWTAVSLEVDDLDNIDDQLGKIDQTMWKPGIYHFRSGAWYILFQLKDNGEWEAIDDSVFLDDEDSE